MELDYMYLASLRATRLLDQHYKGETGLTDKMENIVNECYVLIGIFWLAIDGLREDCYTNCVLLSLNKDITYLLTYLLY